MGKMSLERFLEIKNRIAEIVEIFLEVDAGKEIEDERAEALEQELEEISNEIHNSDLSDIPAESYDGLIDIEFDFEGTKAKLNFDIINESYRQNPLRAKGCEITNFHFDTIAFDEDSFDEEFIEQHKENFWGLSEGQNYPKEVRARYYLKKLTIDDIIQYDLYQKVSEERFDWQAKSLLKAFTIELIGKIDIKLYQMFSFYFHEHQSQLEIEKVSTKEEFDQIMREALVQVMKKGYSLEEDYYKIEISRDGRSYVPEYMIDFPEEGDLREKALRKRLRFSDIKQNLVIFRTKKFMHFVNFDRENITEEQLIYLFDHFSEFVDDIIEMPDYVEKIAAQIDVQKSLEENTTKMKEAARKLFKDEYSNENKYALRRLYGVLEFSQDLREYESQRFQTILRYTTPETIESYGIPYEILGNSHAIYALEAIGFETLMEFDKENGNIFTKDNYSLLLNLYEHYLHYDGNNHNPRTNIMSCKKFDWEKGDDYHRPFTKEEFEEAVVRIIKQGYLRKAEIDYRNFSKGFQERHPEMFLPEKAPDRLKDLFYTRTLTLEELADHEEWIEFLKETDYSFGIQTNIIVDVDNREYAYARLEEYLSHFYDKEEGLRELIKYKKYISFNGKLVESLRYNGANIIDAKDGFYFELIEEALKQKIKQSFLKDLEQEDAELYLEEIVRFQPRFLEKIRFNHDFENPTRELIRVMIENRLANKIIDGELGYEEYDFDEEFKQSHPELFLDKDAPQELKDRYYSVMTANSFKLDDLLNPEYQKYLIGKEFPRAESALRRLRDMFSVEEIIELGKIDKEALKIYGISSDEGIARLAFMLEKFPDKKEEIISMPGLILYGAEELTETHFREYKNLQENNALKNAMPNREDITVRQIYEQILAHMYGFLGFDQAKKLLEEPDIDPESLNQIYEIDGRIKDLYEKKFEITGNIKLLTMLLNGMPGLLPGAEKLTSKANLNLFKALNEQITEEYQGDVRGLLAECLARTGQPENPDAIDALVKRIIQLETEMKLDKLREYTSARVEVDILENAKTRKRIKEIYRDAIKYSLNLSENVDIALLREYLSKEFSRTKESGEPFYSPHVTEHLEDLIHITEELLQNPEKAKIANKTLIDCLKEEKAKIGNRWLMKIALAYNAPEKMTYEEAVNLDEMIYGKDSEHEVETEETVGIKVLTDEEKRRIYEILGNTQYANVLTFNKAEIMFSALTPPYSEEFKEFFLAHKAEFIQNPEYYTIFTKAHRKFEEIIRDTGIRTRYDEGLFTLKDLVNEVNKITYTNVRPGEHELEYWARKAGLTPEQFQIAQKLYEEMKKREEITIPPEQYTGKRYRGRIVRIDDPLHLVIGEITNCCQTIGANDPGESSMVHSATERNGSLFVVEEINENGEPIRIVAQSWTWRNGNRVTFDNVEIPSSVRAELEAIGGFDEIMEVYEGAASQMIQTDRLALQKLLKSGRITQEQYRQMLIKDIAMGKGCDDLIRGVSNEMRKNHPNLEQPSVLPLEIDKRYTGATEKNLYTDARSTILIAHNPDFEQDDHKAQFLEVADLGLKYTKTRDIFHRTGTDIDSDKIETIKALLQRNGRLESSILKDAKFIQDIFYKLVPYGYRRDEIDLDIYRVAMSESGDWFIFTEEQDGGIFVHESGLDTEFPENASEKEKLDRKMALAEYTKEMLEMMQRAADSHKKVMIDAEREGKFLTLNSLVENGEIELSEDGVITILDGEKLNQRIEQLNKVIEESRKDRSIADIGEER